MDEGHLMESMGVKSKSGDGKEVFQPTTPEDSNAKYLEPLVEDPQADSDLQPSQSHTDEE